MLFQSLDFALFFPIVFIFYWIFFNRSALSQNLVLLSSSLVFYGWIDWRFLAVIIFHALFNFFIGIRIANTIREGAKKKLFCLGIIVNIGVLCYFKYFNFFFESFSNSLNVFGANDGFGAIHIILPLGISFFTFQSLGYLIDIFNDEIKPNRNVLVFATYVMFFPKVLAGPIERAQRFIPQIERKRVFDYSLATDGLRQILWGLFKKLVIADNCALIVNQIFYSEQDYAGSTLIVGLFLYMFQIYCDFSGYSDMATGLAKLLGIRLMRNSAFPYFATSISSFWRKWHISLTSWMMDYVFTPLSFMFRRYKKTGLIISIMITFLIVGLWHGGTLVFMILGVLSGIYYIPTIVKGSVNSSLTVARGKILPSLKDCFQMLGTFLLLMIAITFILSDSISGVFNNMNTIFSISLFAMPEIRPKTEILLIIFLVFIEWFGREDDYAIANMGLRWPRVYRWGFYGTLIFFIGLLMETGSSPFVYFNF